MEYSSIRLHNKLCSTDTDQASPLANLEAFGGGSWPLPELLEIRTISRAAICSVVTGLVVTPRFSVNFGAMDVLLSTLALLSSLPSFSSVFRSPLLVLIHLLIHKSINCGSPLCQTLIGPDSVDSVNKSRFLPSWSLQSSGWEEQISSQLYPFW